MGERAQYFLEQSIPELLDLQEKKIFTSLEIKAITRKRTSFEQALTRKIVRKADFLRYIEYEINLEALRVQRCKRLQIKGKKSISDWAGPRRIFFIFERATKRFHGDVNLWLQYIDYAKQEKSNKILGKVYTSLLQYHPTNPAMWTLAAEHEMTWNGNMTAARTLMQRGLRLNTGSKQLWLDYFKLELDYLNRIYARRKVLGLDGHIIPEPQEVIIAGLEDGDSATIAVPKVVVAESVENDKQDALLKDVELSTLSTAQTNPALQGAIPKVILASAVKALPNSPQLLLDFYNCLANYAELPFSQDLQSSIIDMLSVPEYKANPQACFLRATMPLTSLKNDVTSAKFPAAFRECLALYKVAETETSSHLELVSHWTRFLTTDLLATSHLDGNLKKAICATIRQAYKSEQLDANLYADYIRFEDGQGKVDRVDQLIKEATSKYENFRAPV